MDTQYKMGKTEWMMLLSLSVLWGFSFINIKQSLLEITPFNLVLLRLTLAFLTLLFWCLITRKQMKISVGNHLRLIVGGLISCAIPFSFFTWGQQYVSTSIGSVFSGCVPFFTAFFAHFILGGSERINTRKMIGLTLGFAGIITIMGIDKLGSFDLTNLGQLAMICACFFYAISGIYYQKVVPSHLDKTVITTYTLFWAALAMSMVSIPLEGLPSLDYTAKTWLSLSILSVMSTALAYIIVFRLLKRAGPSNTSINTFLIPVVGILVGISLLDETLSSNDLLGVGLIFSGVAIIQNVTGLLRKLRKKPKII
ncbi:MAG: DMT family transporter [Oceanospirillaceae bacterium]|nr:DMT family transporter [Oceanospirillaceae bacterium]